MTGDRNGETATATISEITDQSPCPPVGRRRKRENDAGPAPRFLDREAVDQFVTSRGCLNETTLKDHNSSQ